MREDEDGLLAPAKEADLAASEVAAAEVELDGVHIGGAVAITGIGDHIGRGAVVDPAEDDPPCEGLEAGIERIVKLNFTP